MEANARGIVELAPPGSGGREQLKDHVLKELRLEYGNINTLFIHVDVPRPVGQQTYTKDSCCYFEQLKM